MVQTLDGHIEMTYHVFFVYIVKEAQPHIGKYLLSNLFETSQHMMPIVFKDGLRF